MIHLRALTDEDVALIQHWPPYPQGFEELDYALREQGWLAEYGNHPDMHCNIASEDGEPIGFAILAKTADKEARFRVALRGDKIGRGYGEAVTRAILDKGFYTLNLERIRLIVRKTNPRAQRLYQKVGFVKRGECIKEIRGKPVEFVEMTIERMHYRRAMEN